MSLSES